MIAKDRDRWRKRLLEAMVTAVIRRLS